MLNDTDEGEDPAAYARGRRNEERFFALAQKTSWNTPLWFLCMTRTSPEWDVRGVDAFAWILFKKSGLPVRVPVQVKGSAEGARKFRKDHVALSNAGIPIILVHERLSDAEICAAFYRRLEHVRNNGTTFDRVLDFLINKPLSDRGKVLLEEIRSRSRHEWRHEKMESM